MATSGFYSSSIFSARRNRSAILLGMLSFITLSFLCTTAQAQFAGGTGTSGDPYQIDSAEGLDAIRVDLDAQYILIADIDLTTATGDASGAYWNGGEGWEPIGDFDNPFTGSIDGGGYTITGLFIDRLWHAFIGLFGETGVGSEFMNMGLVEVNITGGPYTGGLVGRNDGTITGSYVTGRVSGDLRVGGLVGRNSYGSITGSYATGSVSGSSYVGGLVGENYVAITNSYATGDVTGSNSDVGGLIGINIAGSITDSYATGEVDGDDDVGGFVGDNLSGTITTSYWNTETSGTTSGVGNGSSSGVTGLTDEEMRQVASFTGFDFGNVWQIDEGIAYPVLQNNEQVPPPGYVPVIDSPADGATRVSLTPTLQWQSVYEFVSYDVQISTDSEFNTLVEDETGITGTEYTLSGELNVGTLYYWRIRGVSGFGQAGWASAQFRTAPSPNGAGTGGDPWEIATADQLHAVRYYLGDHYIQTANIDLTTATGESTGDYWNGGEGWEPIGTNADRFTGSIDGAGYTITGLFIDRDTDNIALIGGLGGGGTVEDIHLVEVDITGLALTGGLVARNDGTINDSSVTGSVSGVNYVGGLVGNNGGSVTNSYAMGSVSGGSSYLGGLVGQNYGTITSSYATGSVSGSFYVGGLVGLNFDTVTDSYATGSVSGGNFVGGLVGSNANTVTTSYWNTVTSGTTSGVADGSSSGVTGLTSEQMRQEVSFEGFDFDNDWQIESGAYTSYPYLQAITYDELGTEPEINPIPGLFTYTADGDNILYVDQNVEVGGNGSGNSWVNAIPELRDALAWAQEWDGDAEGPLKIWVADGTYLPTEGADREASFQMINHVEIYGGFAGDEDPDGFDLADRNFEANETILSGDVGVEDDDSDNAYHVFYHHPDEGTNLDNSAVLDGVTISGGRADGFGINKFGAGMYNNNNSPILMNVTFKDNISFSDDDVTYGGGMYNENSDPVLANVIFSGNEAQYGGAMHNRSGSSPTLTNVTFHANEARFGGGIYNHQSSPTLINVLSSGNNAIQDGGGMLNYKSSPILTNVTISDNTDGGMINTGGSYPILKNSIVWGNSGSDINDRSGGPFGTNSTTIENSIVSGEDDPDNGNIDENPLFMDPISSDSAPTTEGDYRLQTDSPAISAGNNEALPDGITSDLAGNPRIDAVIVDMGAYEFQGAPTPVIPDENNILYVDQNVNGGNETGSSWTNAIPELRDALAWAQNWDGDTDGTLQIWVAEGIYLSTDDETDRFATFQLVNQVEIYGGFGGGENNLEARNWIENLTILSGDIDGDDTTTDGVVTDTDNISGSNSYHVVNSSGTDDTAVLDGFTITAGLANGTNSATNSGAGLLNDDGTPVLTHLAITGNNARNGGGMYIWGSSPTLSNVLFTANHAEDSGGGIDVINSAPVLTAVIVSGNSASYGGGMFNLYSDPVITGGLFEGNSASYGGGMYNEFSSSILTNLTLTGNTAGNDGGGMYNYREPVGEETSNLTNVIIWGNKADESSSSLSASIYNISQYANPQISHSLIANSGGSNNWANEIGTDGGNNIEADPLFTDPSNGDFTLQNTSLAINAGDNDAVPGGVTTDLAGNPRFFDGGTVDMGAYEFQGEPVTIPEAVVLSTPSDEAANVGLTPEFGWQPLDGADTYNLQVSENEEFSSTVIDESGLTETTFEPASDLGYSTTYYWRARASNAAGDGEWSEAFSFTTLPESSKIVILTDPSDGVTDVPLKPQFEWNPADGADTYDLIVSPNPDFTDPVIDETGISETEFQTADNLAFSAMHYWRVRGVNGGGPGEWSESFSFTTLDQPEAADNRIVLANTESYILTPADFGQTDNSFLVVMEDLSGGFNGDLALDGTAVSTDDKISVDDIDGGNLTYTPMEGSYGYGYDHFDFRIEDNEGNQSEESYTMSLDVAATSVELTGGEGWRFLGNPSHGDRFDDLLGPVWTKGVPGSDSPHASTYNVYVLDQNDYIWRVVPNLDDTMLPGSSIIVYVYADDDFDGSPEGFPKTLTSGENWLPLDGAFDYSWLGDHESEANPDNFYLVANPHPIAIDFCEMFDKESVDLANSVVIWDPSVNSGNGDYRNLSCSTGEVFIAPFQGFWIRTTGNNPELEIHESAYLEGTTDGYFKDSERSDGFVVGLHLSDETQTFTNKATLMFSEEGTAGLDAFDAPKLSPEGLANRWLSFYSLDENHKAYAFQSLPVSHLRNDKVRIPLNVQTTEPGRFTLDWTLPETHIFSGSYFLRDNQTGEVIELREGSKYSFEITADQTSKSSGGERSAKSLGDFADLGMPAGQPSDRSKRSDGSTPRFELLITAAGVDGLTELGAVPDDFTLAQNYPNPFNPTTVISYQLPVSSEVRLEVYDMVGRTVATLVNGQVSAGRHTVNFDAGNLSSGIYLYRLQAGSQVMTRKLTVVK